MHYNMINMIIGMKFNIEIEYNRINGINAL